MSIRSLVWFAACWLGCVSPALLAADDLERVVEFRDGTLLLVHIPDQTVPWKEISKDGTITDRPIQYSAIQSLSFVLEPASAQVAAVRKLISQLGADNYQDREAAQRQLEKEGAKFYPIIEQMRLIAEEAEVQYRLDEILSKLESQHASVGNDYDRLLIKGKDQEVDGDVGDWRIRGTYRGIPIELDRHSVIAVHDRPLSLTFEIEKAVAKVEEIKEDRDQDLPSDLVRIDFDRGPNGGAVSENQDISTLYADRGCLFSSSIPDSFISIFKYSIEGRSRRYCAGNNQPPYEGVTTVRFCVPGNPKLAAGVHVVGFWTSYVMVGGTGLRAFDAQGNLLGEVKTDTEGVDFVALRSNTPIASVQIVPYNEIDPNYAFDDFFFDRPTPLIDSGHPELDTLVLKNGERLQGRGLRLENDRVVLQSMTIGLKDVSVPMDELAAVIPVHETIDDSLNTGPFLQLKDSSILRAEVTAQGLQFQRFSALKVDQDRLAALWSPGKRGGMPASKLLEDGASVIVHDKQATPIQSVRLGPDWIQWERSDGDPALAFTYHDSPLIYFALPEPRDARTGLLRTTSGEELRLGPSYFNLAKWSAEQVTVERDGQQVTIPLNEVRSIRFPLAE